VLVVEVSNKLGKKILMSGGGRCNFTNLKVDASHFICDNLHFVKSALSQFTQWDFIAMVSAHGIAFHEKDHGQLFCDNSAKDILAMLVDQCRSVGVEFLLNCEVKSVSQESPFELQSSVGVLLTSNLVVATGGLSIPTLGGATGLGYKLAEQFGLSLNPTQASLVPFTLSGKWHAFASALSGVSLPVQASVAGVDFAENLLFAHRGLSGPVILQLSNYWHLGEEISIDVLPAIDLAVELIEVKRSLPNTLLSAFLSVHLPKSLSRALYAQLCTSILQIDEPDSEPPLQQYRDLELERIGAFINNWCFVPRCRMVQSTNC
jgi:predicted Rossmann fold flavoprotein